jgi:hypothetical protein
MSGARRLRLRKKRESPVGGEAVPSPGFVIQIIPPVEASLVFPEFCDFFSCRVCLSSNIRQLT